MYVCVCHGVTDKDIKKAAQQGAKSLQDVQQMTGCATGCGTCAETAAEVLHTHNNAALPHFLDVLKRKRDHTSDCDWQVPA